MSNSVFTLNRRHAVLGIGAGLGGVALSGCSIAVRRQATLDEQLSDLIQARSLTAAGLVVRREGEIIYAGAAGYAAGLSPDENAMGVASRPFLTSSKFRVASMTKSVVALAAIRLAQSGEVSLDADVSDYLGYAFRHPDAPDQAITLTMLLAHTSGVTDPDNYWSVPSGRFKDLLTPYIFRPLGANRLGDFFEYANINYGIAAAALENAAGERFDHLTKRLALDPLGLDVGLNWSGVSPEMRALGASLYRRDKGADWRIQIDGPDMLTNTEPAVLLYGGATLEAYQIGANGALFSPQGGLRASLEDLVIIADAVQKSPEMRQPIWTRDAAGDNGIHDDSFFQSIGLGSFLYTASDSPWTGKDIIGHHGEAYGLHGAYWATLDEDIQIAYAAVGIPEIPPMRAVHPALNIYTAPLMALAQDALA